MELVIERRAVAANGVLDARLHPVLRRAYAARGVRDSRSWRSRSIAWCR